MGTGTAIGNYDLSKLYVQFCFLTQDFRRAPGVTQAAHRRRATGRNHQRFTPCSAQLSGPDFGLGQRIFTLAQHVHPGAKQVVEEHIAVEFVVGVALGHGTTEDQFTAQAQAGAHGGRQARVIGLDTAHRDECIDTVLQGRAEVKLQFTQFIAATTDQHMVIAFDK